ncbi:excisionase family DNA binding protein [Breoghania corrubedonensis]|uniref:Excisionase family DNA binding protein n=1 Tax=Breoghania corrubedonensis TaxID=665038 RepID=A0A2T5V4R7_9HYPH|nr:helix-turn-helix transcriptional regulator [Breoghania corrubedonensis]PTW58733.1 excisionase family DNA binding protein [Breoghania corrubedonensis]
MTSPLPSYLTTREMAELLRVKERKVYDLVATGAVPHSRATGKLLFPREAVLAWIESAGGGEGQAAQSEERPNVVLGSHDPLLEWALRESGSGLASFFDGSFDGLERFAERGGIAAGLHVSEPDPEGGEGLHWNQATVVEQFSYRPVVLIEWAWRERGLIVAKGNPLGLSAITDLAGVRVVQRQAKAGSQRLMETMLLGAGLKVSDLRSPGSPARDERDAALAVLEGKADAAFGLSALAHQFKLDFVPLCRERYDLLVWRRAWFEPPLQTLVEFCRTTAFAEMTQEFGGYDVSGLGKVRFNGA